MSTARCLPWKTKRLPAATADAPPSPTAWSAWVSALRAREATRDAEIAVQAATPVAPVSPLHVCRAIEAALPEDATVVADGGDFVATASYVIRPRRPLSWLDRACRPRWPALIDHVGAHVVTGLLLVVLGLLLGLPIPLTNYPFGIILVVFAVALIERDGKAMALAWALGVAEVLVVVLFFEEAAQALIALAERVAAWF